MQLFSNNAKSTLAAGINDTDVALSVTTGEGALFAAPTGGDYQMITLTNAAKTAYETVKCTARSADTLTILRAQEGTTALSWSAGATVFAGATKGTLENLVQTADSRLSGIGDMLLTLRTPPADYLAADGSTQSAAAYPDLAALLTVTPAAWAAATGVPDKTWRRVCWSPALGLFAAVSDTFSGATNIMTSPDGATWTSRTSPAQSWSDVCWSPELALFCAVGSEGTNNRVCTSPDGITWTSRTGGGSQSWQAVAWSPTLGLFVAVANNPSTAEAVMTSPDGITWTFRSSADIAGKRFTSLCWSPELALFCAVSGSGYSPSVVTSPDGITWTARTDAGTDHWWTDVTWSPTLGLFAAVANYSTASGEKVMTSPDGITWTLRVSAADLEWMSIEWNSITAEFVAVAQTGTGNRIMTSPDGIAWTGQTSPADNDWQALAFSPTLPLMVAVASSGTTGTRAMYKGVDTFATPDWSGISATGTAYVKAL